MTHGYAVELSGRAVATGITERGYSQGVSYKRCHGANSAANPAFFAMYSFSTLADVLPAVLMVLQGHSATMISCFVYRVLHRNRYV